MQKSLQEYRQRETIRKVVVETLWWNRGVNLEAQPKT
jgi:hypothetical protein